MTVIAVVNRKGGSGKSTLATHLAAYLARDSERVLLGDVDRQLSTQIWLKRRGGARSANVVGWSVEPKSMVRPPSGSTHVVLDTPGGLRGFDLARVVMYADAVLMPICNSVFDRESAAECAAELRVLPRVSSGRCRLAAVGMRVDSRSRTVETMTAWARDAGIDYLGALRYSPQYVSCIEDGLTLFDLPAAEVRTDLEQWQPILAWLDAIARTPAGKAETAAEQAPVPRPAVRRVAPAVQAKRTATVDGGSADLAARVGRLLGAFAIPQFLQRDRTL